MIFYAGNTGDEKGTEKDILIYTLCVHQNYFFKILVQTHYLGL